MLSSPFSASNMSCVKIFMFSRYTPYFFDKNMLDKILEESVDQHFHSLIKTRHSNRRRDIVDDSMASEVFEENAESIWEPPEVHDQSVIVHVNSKQHCIEYIGGRFCRYRLEKMPLNI